MRTFTIATFILAASLTPLFASAQQVLTGSGNNQVLVGAGNPNNTANKGTNVTLLNPLRGVDCNSGGGNCLSAFLINILQFVIRIGSIIVVLMLVYVGYLFVVAQGKEAEIREARNALLWTVVGALILLGAQAIASGIQATVRALGG